MEPDYQVALRSESIIGLLLRQNGEKFDLESEGTYM
jgi:hypothetical protein